MKKCFFIILSLIISCSSGGGKTDISRKELMKIAEEYIRIKYPNSIDDLKLKSIITDNSNYYIVTFKLPEDSLGGVPVIYIDKVKGKVIKAYHTQ